MDTKIIGGKIAQARKAHHMSQAQLAKQLFISPQAVGKWERGESMPDITTFNRLAELLGVDLNYFSSDTPPAAHEIASDISVEQPSVPENKPGLGSPERQVSINLAVVDLQGTNFAGAVLHKGKFKTSPLRGANFAGADLTGSSFEIIDAQEANFDSANLTDCHFSITDLTDASFHKSILVRTVLSMSGQGAKFVAATLTDVTLSKADLRKTTFEQCIFNNVDFNACDLRGLCLDGQTFIGVRFDKSVMNDVSFRGATLRHVSFKLPFSLTNKSYLAMKTVCFDGAMMDKLTFAALKGLRTIDLSKVSVI
ncbi:pentapeptide repeat-containing protein [Chitinophaga nivalis]|uniref:Pentapeptide repeat-containing protein n=1 Tax=Chitinophaga nivalis TaxID=2991709 RepID=A0ABT3IMF5_9BACT|nr:pentapeptide repeat-containing protein [Chitinophaga nivalis]MCW3465158.1 pentapeptide repeat-containing protein [Chitinophaga nivalis]MCW3485150.1 pentapeptide repeat-containing protein [Chitinophaga nivalis]